MFGFNKKNKSQSISVGDARSSYVQPGPEMLNQQPQPKQTKPVSPLLSSLGNNKQFKNAKENIVSPAYKFFTADPTKQKVLASTQDHLDIYDIRNDIVLLKNGDVSLIIETTAVNFQLLSGHEQDMKISAFSELINSLNFELQVVIHTEPIDMRRYLNFLAEHYKKINKPGLKKQMGLYMKFVKELVIQNNILQKRFFVVIPHRSGQISADQVNPFQKGIDVVLGRKRVTQIKNADKLVEKALIQLIPKRDHVMKMLSRMGLGSKQLNNKELVQLFYSYYNPVEHVDTFFEEDQD